MNITFQFNAKLFANYIYSATDYLLWLAKALRASVLDIAKDDREEFDEDSELTEPSELSVLMQRRNLNIMAQFEADYVLFETSLAPR